MLWNHIGKIKGDKVPLFSEYLNVLEDSLSSDSNKNVRTLSNTPTELGWSSNQSLNTFQNITVYNKNGLSTNTSINSIEAHNFSNQTPLKLSSYKFSVKDVNELQKKQKEQSVLIENVTNMISRLV